MSELIFGFEQALDTVLAHAALVRKQSSPRTVETVPLLAATGRTLNAALCADRDQPPFDRSTRDGYAVRAADHAADRRVGGVLRAGEARPAATLHPGEAIEIMTGAPMPAGANAVVMVEHATRTGDRITIEAGRAPHEGENFVPAGAEARAGDVVVPAGTRIGVSEIAIAAACGASSLSVFPRPDVAVIATGDELVDVGQAPAPHQIRNSNSYALAALIAREGACAASPCIAGDTREDLLAKIAAAQTADLLLLSGGVSMGKYDLVEQVLREDCGAEFFFTGALIQPGKPVVFGRMPRRVRSTTDYSGQDEGGRFLYFFGLPGNPVSTHVTFLLFVAPLLRALCGRSEVAPRFVEAHLAENLSSSARITRFLPAVCEGDWKAVTVRPVAWQGSGDLAANARANGFVVLPPGGEGLHAGDTVRVLLR